MKVQIIFAVVLVIATSFSANAQEAEFIDLGTFRPVDVSLDGSVVIGHKYSRDDKGAVSWNAAYWTRDTGVESLGTFSHGGLLEIASSVSGDGTVIFGSGLDENGESRGFRWTAETGAVNLRDSLGVGPAGESLGIPTSVSADGSIVIGNLSGGAYRWTAETGAELLPSEIVWAVDMSADGSVIVGRSHGPVGKGYRWTQESGLVQLIWGDFPLDDVGVEAISADGSVIVGTSYGEQGFRWTEETGFVPMSTSRAFEVSGDGSIMLVETAINIVPASGLWDATNGVRPIGDVFTREYGLTLNGWGFGGVDYGAKGISADGTVIVGDGHAFGSYHGWMVIVPEPSSGVLSAIAGLTAICGLAIRRRNRL